MTGFDNLMRSQQMVQGDQQFYDQQRYQSDLNMRNTLAQVPGQAVDTFLAVRQADSSLRLQEAETQHQLQINKIQMMSLVDDLDLKRQAVKAGNLDLDMRAFDLKRMQEEYERSVGSDAQKKSAAWFDQIGGVDTVLSLGMIPEIQDGKFSYREPKDDAELAKAIERRRRVRGGSSEERLMGAEERRRLDADRARAKERLEYLELNGGTEEEIAAAQQNYKRLLDGGGYPQPEAASPQHPVQQERAEEPPPQDERSQALNSMKSRFNIQGIDGKPHYGEQEATWIATALTDRRDEVLSLFKQAVSGDRSYKDDEEAMQGLLMAIRDPYAVIQQEPFLITGQLLANALMHYGGAK